MKELVEKHRELSTHRNDDIKWSRIYENMMSCRYENMKYQERITKSIDYLAMIARDFDELGAHNPYAEHVKIILQQVEEMRRIHRPIKARMIYDEMGEKLEELEWNVHSDIGCDGMETFIPYLKYGCGANRYEEQYAGRRCQEN